MWDVESGRELHVLKGNKDFVNSAAFSPDGHRIVMTNAGRTARVWDSETGRELQVLIGHQDRVLGANYSPDGRRIVTASRDGTARVWNSETGRVLQFFQTQGIEPPEFLTK